MTGLWVLWPQIRPCTGLEDTHHSMYSRWGKLSKHIYTSLKRCSCASTYQCKGCNCDLTMEAKDCCSSSMSTQPSYSDFQGSDLQNSQVLPWPIPSPWSWSRGRQWGACVSASVASSAWGLAGSLLHDLFSPPWAHWLPPTARLPVLPLLCSQTAVSNNNNNNNGNNNNYYYYKKNNNNNNNNKIIYRRSS